VSALLRPALYRPINHYLYDPAADLAQLVAAYGFGLAKNHAIRRQQQANRVYRHGAVFAFQPIPAGF